MRKSAILVAACAAAVSLAGCTTSQNEASAAKPPAEATECGAERVGSFVNQQATPNVLSQIEKAAGHNRIRKLDPQSVVTMDYRSDRLNVDTDADGRIVRLRCG